MLNYFSNILSLFIVVLTTSLTAQTVTYFDVDWDTTTAEYAHYFRHVYEPIGSDSIYHIQEFYLDSTLYEDAFVTTIEYRDNYVGWLKKYYSNGMLKYTVYYDPKTLKKEGEAKWYLRNGSLLVRGIYKDGYSYDGIVRNRTYAARFTKLDKGKLVSRRNYYKDSHQIAEEVLYQEDKYNPLEIQYFDKEGKEMGRLKFADKPGWIYDSGVHISFYKDLDWNLSVETIRHYRNEKAEGEQISYKKNGEIWLKGVNKNNKHFEGQFLKGNEIWTVRKGVLQRIDFYHRKGNLLSTLYYKNGEKWKGVETNLFVDVHYRAGKKTKVIEFFDARKLATRYIKTFKDSLITYHWFDRKNEAIGVGKYIDGEIWEGLKIIYRMDNTIYSHYKAGKKSGIEQLFDDKDLLLSEKIYIAGKVVQDKTLNPITGKMVNCEYRNGEAYNGRFFEYNVESIFKEGKLIQKNEYKNKQLIFSEKYE